MPTLKNRMIFISHAWQYNGHYWKLVNWFNEKPNFSWNNCSVPSHDVLTDKTPKGLSEGMTRQMRPAQVVIILGGMYAAHSSWIDYEIQEAQRMGKSIIGVRPWDQQRVPLNVQNASSIPMVGWNRASVIQAVRNLT
ncbi:MAG: nuclease [Gammaproteobacteria bacterium]|nr:nuclease [Gammaproteobacteria bacterium]